MSRPSDQERGARIAAWQASEMLAAHLGGGLFPLFLSRAEVRLWRGILDAAQLELADSAALHEARKHG